MKDIPGYEGKYAITEDGRIWSYPQPLSRQGSHLTGRFLKPKAHVRGYLSVCLRNGLSSKKWPTIHRLVLQTYKGPAPEGYVANHLNGDKTDNRIENLEWVSQKANIHHARDVLGAYKGERNGRYIDGRRMKA